MELKFISRVRKGNNKGTGFISLPTKRAKFFNLNDWVQVKVMKNKFFGKIIFYSSRLGVYLPKRIVIENNLINKQVEIRIRKINGFYAKISSDGRIFIPQDIVEKQKLKHNDIVLIQAIENGKIICERFSKVTATKRKNRSTEYYCVFDRAFQAREVFFKLKKLPKEINKEKLNQLIPHLLRGMPYAFLSKDSIIVFGHKMSIIISPNINYSNLAFYFGAYFADGTKKGNSWAISASTFEQAKYYLKMHNLIVKNPNLKAVLSYTNINNENPKKVLKKLARVWEEKTGIKIHKFRIRKSTGKNISKWNKYGTLIFREGRQILLDIYDKLLKTLIKKILVEKNKKLALDFLCGVMEGDGSVPALKRGHVSVSANEEEVKVLKNILKVAQIKFKFVKEGNNRYYLRIGALEILKNFYSLKDKIFILYPKRRKLFFERLKTVGAVKFLIENHQPTSWVKAWLRENGFCDKNYKLTNKGLRLGAELIANINEVME